jgi:hypothetical protein
MLDMPAIVNTKLSQRMLRSYWFIPFTQERPGKNPVTCAYFQHLYITKLNL